MNLGFILILILMSFQAYCGDKGNGGSGTETQIAAQQTQLELVAMEIRRFFLENEFNLRPEFPEFDIKDLTRKIKVSDIIVVNQAKLIDKHGKSRTCLNFPKKSLIKCKYSEVVPLGNYPTGLFVLVFHEYLGLIGAEETSPSDPRMIDGYSISRRLVKYISYNGGYGLKFNAKEEEREERRASIVSSGEISTVEWSVVPKKTKRIKVQMDAKGASIEDANYLLYVRGSSKDNWELMSQGKFERLSSNQLMSYIAFEPGKEFKLLISGEAIRYHPVSDFFSDMYGPHTERLRLIVDDEVIIFDREFKVEKYMEDLLAPTEGTVFLNYDVIFK